MEIRLNYWNIIRRWWWLFLLAALTAGVATYWFSSRQPVFYEARARLIVGPGVDSPNPDLNALRTGGQLMQTYAKLATTRPMLDTVIDKLGLPTTADILDNNVAIRTDQETQILTIVTTDDNPDRAVSIANAIAEELVGLSSSAAGTDAQLKSQIRTEAERVEDIVRDTEDRIAELEDELAALENGEGAADPLNEAIITESQARIQDLESQIDAAQGNAETQRLLLEQLAQERTRLTDAQARESQQKQRIIDSLAQERTRLSDAHRTLATLYDSLQKSSTNQIKIIESAETKPIAPQLRLRMLVGATGGFIVAFLIVVGFELLNTTIYSVEELRRTVDRPLLGTIRRDGDTAKNAGGRLVIESAPDSRMAEDYRILGTKLLFATQDTNTPPPTVLLSTPEGQEMLVGEVAANLALALTEADNQVLLVDANTRKPTIGTFFDVDDAPASAGANENEDGTPFVRTDWSPKHALTTITPRDDTSFQPSRAATLNSSVEQLQQQIGADIDIVIFVAPPLLSFADSLMLSSRTDGVLLLVSSGETTRQAARESVAQLLSLGVHTIGTVFVTDSDDRIAWPLDLPRLKIAWQAMKGHGQTASSDQSDEVEHEQPSTSPVRTPNS